MRWGGFAAAAMAAIGLVACSSDPAAAPTTTTIAAEVPPPVTDAPAGDPELVAWMMSLLDVPTAEELTIFLDWNVPQDQVKACVNAAGFDYDPGPTAAEQVADDLRYSLPPDEYAAQYGFGIVAGDIGLMPTFPDPNAANFARLNKDQRQAFQRTVATCSGLGNGERMDHGNAMNAAIERIRPVLNADATVIAALDEWRACVTAAGATFATPQQMRESFYSRMNSTNRAGKEALFEEEKALATAVVPCQQAYRDAYRAAALAHVDDFEALYDTARTADVEPAAQG